MLDFDVQFIQIAVPADRVFKYIADPGNLPEWTHAFKSIAPGKATLQTEKGNVEISLSVRASASQGTIDWKMSFPDGSVGMAYSRVCPTPSGGTAYSFVLLAPPVPAEQIEGALVEQSLILERELEKLKQLLEATKS